MAALSVTYSFEFERTLDPTVLTANADATSLADGGVAVVGDHEAHIDPYFFGPDGEVTGGSQAVTGSAGAIAQLGNGNIVMALDTGGQASFTIVSATGAVLVAPTASDDAFTELSAVDVTALAGGGFVVASQALIEGTDHDIRVNIRDNDGALVASFAVDGTAANDQAPSVAALADGGFAIAWHRIVGTASEMWYAVYDANGTERKLPTLLDNVGGNLNASVVALDNGGFAIAYEDTGWTATGDTDITLALFDAAGTRGGWVDLSQNDYNDTLPSTTLLSNGLIVVGSTSAEFGKDPKWTLVDPENGDRLTSIGLGQTINFDTDTTVAGMLNGQVATFFTNVNTADVIGQVLQVRRFTNGDTYADDYIVGDELVDYFIGGGGNDTVRGGGNADYLAGSAGNDTFLYGAGEMVGDTILGDEDFDRIMLLASANLSAATIGQIEEIEFAFPAVAAITATIGAGQVGAGLASDLVVDGESRDAGDTLRVVMGNTGSVDLSGLVFFDFDSSATGPDRVQVWGDDDAEIIVGSAQADTVLAAGGNDTLTGGGGIDTLRGGLGDDTYNVNAAGEAREAADEGVDTVNSRITYSLGANIEHLVLLGPGDAGGTGNDLNNRLTGNNGANALDGGLENDLLDGGLGQDTLTGGAGFDRFDFNATAHSAPGASDVIADFAGNGALRGDLIDLSTIDADVLAGGNQAFVFIGTAAFTVAGQVRYASGVLLASTDADAQAELRIVLTGNPPLVEADLVL